MLVLVSQYVCFCSVCAYFFLYILFVHLCFNECADFARFSDFLCVCLCFCVFVYARLFCVYISVCLCHQCISVCVCARICVMIILFVYIRTPYFQESVIVSVNVCAFVFVNICCVYISNSVEFNWRDSMTVSMTVYACVYSVCAFVLCLFCLYIFVIVSFCVLLCLWTSVFRVWVSVWPSEEAQWWCVWLCIISACMCLFSLMFILFVYLVFARVNASNYTSCISCQIEWY